MKDYDCHKVKGINKIEDSGDDQKYGFERHSPIVAHGVRSAKSYKRVHAGPCSCGVCTRPVNIGCLLKGLGDKPQKPASPPCNGACGFKRLLKEDIHGRDRKSVV